MVQADAKNMTNQEKNIANAMLAEIENTKAGEQSCAIDRYQRFIRSCADRRDLESPLPRRTATEYTATEYTV